MIAPTVAIRLWPVPQTGRGLLHLSDVLRDEAALELAGALGGASQKKIDSASVPGAGASYLSRAMNGGDCNPLYRMASLLLLMKRLGMGRARALQVLGWLAEIIDAIWPPADLPTVEKALEEDSALDPEDDHVRYMAARGCPDARTRLLDVKRRQVARGQVVIAALRRESGTTSTGAQ